MRHHQQNLPGRPGSSLTPNGASKLSVTDTVISNYRLGHRRRHRDQSPSGGSAQVALERVTVNGNAFGIAADGSSSTGGINMTIADSMVGGNSQDGIIATTPGGGAPIGVMVNNTKSVNNAIGIRSIGPNVTVRVKIRTSSATARAWLLGRRRAAFLRQQRGAGQRHERRVLRTGQKPSNSGTSPCKTGPALHGK